MFMQQTPLGIYWYMIFSLSLTHTYNSNIKNSDTTKFACVSRQLFVIRTRLNANQHWQFSIVARSYVPAHALTRIYLYISSVSDGKRMFFSPTTYNNVLPFVLTHFTDIVLRILFNSSSSSLSRRRTQECSGIVFGAKPN